MKSEILVKAEELHKENKTFEEIINTFHTEAELCDKYERVYKERIVYDLCKFFYQLGFSDGEDL